MPFPRNNCTEVVDRKQYFGVEIEFDRSAIFQTIDQILAEKKRGYICSVNANIISHSYLDPSFRKIVNGASVNFCDGSLIALALQFIYLKKFKPTVGLDLFLDIIKEKKYTSFFLGSTEPILDGLKASLNQFDPHVESMVFMPLPFYDSIEKFDYPRIAAAINHAQPDIIWVSLGAPKQEKFIDKLLPMIDKGILFAAGAAFPIFSGDQKFKRAPLFFRKIKLEGIFRVFFHEPKRLFPRVMFELKYMLILIMIEIRKQWFQKKRDTKIKI